MKFCENFEPLVSENLAMTHENDLGGTIYPTF